MIFSIFVAVDKRWQSYRGCHVVFVGVDLVFPRGRLSLTAKVKEGDLVLTLRDVESGTLPLFSARDSLRHPPYEVSAQKEGLYVLFVY